MSVSEQDLELLETLLDGELSQSEADALQERLGSDPQLSAVLEQIRAQRDQRRAVFQSAEPQDAEVTALVARVSTAIRREDAWTGRLRALRYVSGLAACITVGFLIGRFMPYGAVSPDGNGIVFDAVPGPMQAVSYSPVEGPYRVLLTDAYGRVIAEQPFTTLDEAREFTEDLSRSQSPSQVRPMRVSDTIYTKGQF